MISQARHEEVGVGFPRRALTISLAIHVIFCTWLCWQPEPPIINRTTVTMGENGASIGIVYLPTDPSLRIPVNEESHRLKYSARVQKRIAIRRHHTAPRQTDEHPTEAKMQAPAQGSPYADSNSGPLSGWGAQPALPLNFPDPKVRNSDLPPGVAGDVVVEVTIDVAGNIVNKKVLQSIGYGIDEKCLAVLENWRFRPARMNGMPIASRQDVHFHFPS
jgi:protein TonB